MIKKKICMLGAFAVGKTSLVKRFVQSIFSEKYLTTVGAKVEKKTVSINDQDIVLVLWDIYGEDEFNKLKTAYLKGASGCLLVIDRTRKDTFETAMKIKKLAESQIGKIPILLVFNKSDHNINYEVDDDFIDDLKRQRLDLIKTSAKTGEGVEDAFLTLTRIMLEG
jgi:small GTP-binding protein